MELLVGAVVSIIVETIKKIYKAFVGDEWQNVAVIGTLLLLSFIGGWFVYFLKATNAWESFYQIVITASAIWALIIRQFGK